MKTIKLIIAAILVMAGMSVMGQWVDGGTYQTTTDAISIGKSTAPGTGATLDVYNGSNAATMLLQSPLSLGTNRIVSNFDLKNETTGDILRFVLRNQGGNAEMVQTAYSSAQTKWLPYLYLNYTTGKYEVRNGINDVEFKNAGNFLLSNTGAVGIGTTVIPSGVKLAVNGKILATEIEVQLQSAWPDFVFNDEYKLKPLSEVENFIHEKGHLPGVPSASEISSNGINLGQMDAILLQKIEELTLHMIELEKKNELLKQQIIDLQK